jgi:hypothetical protein
MIMGPSSRPSKPFRCFKILHRLAQRIGLRFCIAFRDPGWTSYCRYWHDFNDFKLQLAAHQVRRPLAPDASMTIDGRSEKALGGRGVRSVPSVSIEAIEHQSEAPMDGLVCALGQDFGRKGT